MSKQILKKELVFMDFSEKVPEGKFFHIELLSVGYNQMQVISTYGGFNNKGRESVVRFQGENAFKEAKTLFYNKFLEKKAEGYYEQEDIKNWNDAFSEKFFVEHLSMIEKYRDEKRNQYKKNYKKGNKPSVSKCDLCNKSIPDNMYQKISEWARGDGNWDSDENFIGYGKVLCINCQIEHDIFKKSVKKTLG